MNTPSYSVILPAFNEGAHIGACLDSVRANLSAPASMEILVIDNQSTDQTVSVAQAHGARVIENTTGQRLSISALRNIGARESTGDVLVFLDADMIVPADWMEKANDYFRSGFKGALGFTSQVPDTAGWVGRIWGQRLSRKRSRLMEVDFLPGRNIFANRSVFEAAGGFDPAFRTGEDKDFTFRVRKAGFRVLSAPEVCLVHLGYEKSLAELLRKEFWRQSCTLQFARKHGLSLRTLRHPLLSAWHVVCPAAALVLAIGWPGSWAWLAALLLWPLPAVAIGWSETRSRRTLTVFPLMGLTWLRWTAAGVALVSQILRGAFFRRDLHGVV
jgi:glycosyltransferase involved in cell wall biosynthesis